MAEYRSGEVVEITISGARVAQRQPDAPAQILVQFDTDAAPYEWTFPLGVFGVNVERVAPPEWPPQPGDLWRDRDGSPWFAIDRGDDGCYLVRRDGHHDSAVQIASCYGPMELERREEDTAAQSRPRPGDVSGG
jgi:hypothetical protein